jgi:hypothetical protein
MEQSRIPWQPVDRVRRVADPLLRQMDNRYSGAGLSRPDVFEGQAPDGCWLYAILSRDPVGPGGALVPHLSLTKSRSRLPHNSPFVRPSPFEWSAAKRHIAPDLTFTIDEDGSPLCVHGWAE